MNTLTIGKKLYMVLARFFNFHPVKSRDPIVNHSFTWSRNWTAFSPSETFTTGCGELGGKLHYSITWVNCKTGCHKQLTVYGGQLAGEDPVADSDDG